MARVRTRAKRTVYLLFALALLFLLLELNRWLPGTWPGGGGGGFRAGGEMGVDDPTRTATPATPPADAADDPNAVEPAEAPPAEWPPRRGIIVEVRGPDGALASDWRMGVGDGGPEGRRPDAAGTVRMRDKLAFAEGFRIRSSAGLLRHRHGADAKVVRWSIQLPDGKLPPTARRPHVPVRVVDADTGEPLAGAHVDFTVAGMDASRTTDERGVAQVAVDGGAPVELRIRKEGRVTIRMELSPRQAGTPEIALDEEVVATARYAASSASILTARLVDGEGREVARGETSVRGGGSGQRATFRVGKQRLTGAWLETTVGTADGQFVFRRPATALSNTIDVPQAKQVRVLVREVSGDTIRNARARVEMDTFDGAGAEDEPHPAEPRTIAPTADGSLRFLVPAGARTRLLVDVPDAAPMARTLTPLDGTDTLSFVAERGIRIPVRVLAADGKPLAGARVLARMALEGLIVTRTAVTDAQGRAQVGTFAAGSVEVFADAPRHAATARVVDAAGAMGTIELPLVPGYPLRIVVADPFGRALEGVGVEITPAGGGAPLVTMPSAAAQVTGADGVFRLTGLPDRRYDVRLTSPGHATQTLRGARPGAVTWFVTLLRRP